MVDEKHIRKTQDKKEIKGILWKMKRKLCSTP